MATRSTIAVSCSAKACANETSDLTLYNLQDALLFNGTAISIIGSCPTGYYCAPGTFPRVFTYPPGTFSVYIPPVRTGFATVLSATGCESVVTRVAPAGSTAAAITALGNSIIAELAQQQARCDALNLAGPELLRPISLTDLTNLYACAGSAYSDTIFASASPSDAPYTMTVDLAPAWMTGTQTPTSISLTGTPTDVGAITFTIVASGESSYGSKNYTLNVVGIDTASPLPFAAVTAPYSTTLDGSSIPGILTWSVIAGALPAWASLNSVTGVIYGTPGAGDLGTSTFTIEASNGTLACSKEFDLTASGCFSNGDPPEADTTPVAYSFQFVPYQSPDPAYVFAITAGALPGGITLNPATGVISGNPTTPGTFAFTVGVTGVPSPCSKDYSIVAKCQPTVSDTEPGYMGNLQLAVVGTVTLGPFYVIQRTGAAKLLRFTGVGTVYIRTGTVMTVAWGTRVYNDETGVFIANFGANSISGGGGGACVASPANAANNFSSTSCTRYRLQPYMVITGTTIANPCISTIDYYAVWL